MCHLVLQKVWLKGHLEVTARNSEVFGWWNKFFLWLSQSVSHIVSLPASSSSLNHRSSCCFQSFFNLSISSNMPSFKKNQKVTFGSFCSLIFHLVILEALPQSWTYFLCFFAKAVGANNMSWAYMLLCHVMPHRTDSECMRLLKIN